MNIKKEPQFNKEEEVEILKQEIERLKSENKGLKEAVENLMRDDLTGLKRRGFFTEKSRQDVQGIVSPEAEHRKEGFKSISFLFCDIDHFKKINDTYGHAFGDEILKEIAGILRNNVRESDTVCRWGGEEMMVSLLGADEKEAVEKAEQLIKMVEEMAAEKYGKDPKYSGLKISLSIGVSSFEPGVDFEKLVKQADEAMYLAKKEGRNRVKTYSQVLKEQEVKETNPV